MELLLGSVYEQNSTKSMKIYCSNQGWCLTSYDRVIAIYDDSKIILDSYYHDYSTTTSRHLGDFLRRFTDYNTPKEARNNESTIYMNLND